MSSQRKTRLQRRNWLDQALADILETGVVGISVDRLAGALGVTRGSFYHHFLDRADFLQELLAYWEQKWTLEIGEDIEALGLPPAESLLALARMIHHRKAAEYDSVFRIWAMNDRMAHETLKRVDEYRLAVVRGLFQALGFQGLDAESRARMYLYYEIAEPTIFASQDKATQDKLVVERLNLLTDSGPGAVK